MARDFFDELGGTISKTAQSLTERVNSVYESQKLRNKIAGEERMAEKLMCDIGKVVFTRFTDGADMDDDLMGLCEEIRQHMDAIEGLKADAAGKKGMKICPSCKKEVDKEALFCPYCGTQVPDPEPDVEEAEDAEAVDEAEDTVSEAAEDFSEVAEDAAEDTEAAAEEAEENTDTVEEDTES